MRERTPRTMKALASRVALNHARTQRNEALACLQELVDHVRKIGGYVTTDQMGVLWRAEKLLAESET